MRVICIGTFSLLFHSAATPRHISANIGQGRHSCAQQVPITLCFLPVQRRCKVSCARGCFKSPYISNGTLGNSQHIPPSFGWTAADATTIHGTWVIATPIRTLWDTFT